MSYDKKRREKFEKKNVAWTLFYYYVTLKLYLFPERSDFPIKYETKKSDTEVKNSLLAF